MDDNKDIRRILYGDVEAQKAHDEHRRHNECPAPPPPEKGLLSRIDDMEREIASLNQDLWGRGGRNRWFHALHADKPPHRYHDEGRAVWIDWHMRQEDVRLSPGEKLKWWARRKRVQVRHRITELLRKKPRDKTCWGCAGRGSYDAGGLGSDIPCHSCSGTGRKQ
jgi:hypothetical protein